MGPAKKISLDEAKPAKLFYFVANVMVYRASDRKWLLLKRHEREKVHPGKYAMPGGKLEHKDLDINIPTRMNDDVIDFENALEDLLHREVKEEAGIEIKEPFLYVNSVAFIRPDGIPVILLKFAAEYKSGEIELEEDAFTDHAWVSSEETKKLDTIKGIPEEIAEASKLLAW